MATLKVTVPKDSQNIEGVATIRAPLARVFQALSTAQSPKDRDGMVGSGMEGGWRQSVEALGRLVET